MKNSIIFYIVLLGAAYGGIKWTAHSLLEKKKVNLEKTDLHGQITGFLTASNEPVGAQLQGKNIVIYNWNTTCEPCVKDLTKLNEFAASHPGTQVLAVTAESKDRTVGFLTSKKINLNVALICEPEWMDLIIVPISQVFYSADEPTMPQDRRPEVIVIDAAGKVKMYSVGPKSDLFAKMDKALK